MPKEFVVVMGGSPPHPAAATRLDADRVVIAADSGLDHALALGLRVDIVVGDLDSVSPGSLARAEEAGVTVERHPAAKDAIDTELALAAAVDRGATRIVVLGGGGDRLDHVLAGLHTLAHPMLAGVDLEAWIGTAWLRALQGPSTAAIAGSPGAYVSLIPVHGAAVGVTTSGLRFPLHGEVLHPGATRGVSNELLASSACVGVERGALFVIVPYALGGAP